MIEKYFQQIKEDVNRAWKGQKIYGKALFWRTLLLFILNLIGISLLVVFRVEYALQIFLVIFAVSGYVMFSSLLGIFKENLKENLPNLFENERIKYGTPLQDFKCYMIFIGNLSLRGFWCKIVVYKKALIIKFGKNCLVIDDAKYIRLDKAIIGCRCEFEKDKSYIQCRLNNKQLEIIKQWIADMNDVKYYWL